MIMGEVRQGDGCVVLESAHTAQIDGQSYCKSDVVHIQHSYPLKILIPKYANQSNCKWIYPVTFGGGLVGGDQINMDIAIGCNCCGLVTSSESLKIYHCEDDMVTRQSIKYTVEDDALLCVLCDPVVCFKNSTFIQDQVINMTAASNVVFLDWIIGGRVSLEELWTFNSCSTKLSVFVDDKLVLRESCHLEDTPVLSIVQSMAKYQVIGFCVILGRQVEHVTKHLHQLYGNPYKIGAKLNKEVICTFSPLSYAVEENTISGCYIRFMTVSTNQAYRLVKQVIEPIIDVLGAEPFSRST